MAEEKQVCANCGKPYDKHLLWDGNKCEPGSVNGWFPKSVADAVTTSQQKSSQSAKTLTSGKNHQTSVWDEQKLRMYEALKTITKYQTPEQMERRSQKDWGVDYAEGLAMAYENIQQTAQNAIRGLRPKRP